MNQSMAHEGYTKFIGVYQLAHGRNLGINIPHHPFMQ